MVAHGTRKPAGVATIGDLAHRVGALLQKPVQVAFVDVLGPGPAEVLAAAAAGGSAAVVVPAFLSRGYHVHTDLPSQVAASAHPDVTLTPALGPGPEIIRAVASRIAESGWCPGDSVLLGAAGTSNPAGRADLGRAASRLSTLIGASVELVFAASETQVADAVAAQRERGAQRVAVASYLLGEGLFQERLRNSGADAVAAPLGTHPIVVRLIADRFATASAVAGLGQAADRPDSMRQIWT